MRVKLNELTLSNLGQWPLVIKISVLFGVIFFISILGYCLMIHDDLLQLHQLRDQEVHLKTDFNNKRGQLHAPGYRKQLQKMTKRVASILKQLPEKNEMSGLLEEISKIGVVSGLKFKLFAPQTEVPHDFYNELPIKISVVGTYFQLAMFLSRVAEMNRIVTLHDLHIAGVFSKGHKKILEDELVMHSTAKIYRYVAKEAQN